MCGVRILSQLRLDSKSPRPISAKTLNLKLKPRSPGTTLAFPCPSSSFLYFVLVMLFSLIDCLPLLTEGLQRPLPRNLGVRAPGRRQSSRCRAARPKRDLCSGTTNPIASHICPSGLPELKRHGAPSSALEARRPCMQQCCCCTGRERFEIWWNIDCFKDQGLSKL